jgi:hypothetical protein
VFASHQQSFFFSFSLSSPLCSGNAFPLPKHSFSSVMIRPHQSGKRFDAATSSNGTVASFALLQSIEVN